MEQLPYDLSFCHRFNLHKRAGLVIEDDDIASIARIYGVPAADLEKIEKDFQKQVDNAAESVRNEIGYTLPDTPAYYIALGDSITSDRLSYAKIVRSAWKSNSGRRVYDAGISGDTTSDVIDRFYADVLARDFDRITVFLGTNDSRGQNDTYKITLTSLKEYEHNLHYILSRLKESGAYVAVVTLPPVNHERFAEYFGKENNTVYHDSHLERMNNSIRRAAKKHKAGLVDLADAISSSGIDALDEDGLHLSLEGQTLMAKLVLPVLG